MTASRRRALLAAALAFAQLGGDAVKVSRTGLHGRRVLTALHAWLDSWRGLGLIVDGMHRQGYTVSVRNVGVDRGWVASFHGHPMTSAAGFAVAPTPWAAVQQAGWLALRRTA